MRISFACYMIRQIGVLAKHQFSSPTSLGDSAPNPIKLHQPNKPNKPNKLNKPNKPYEHLTDRLRRFYRLEGQ